MLLWNLKPERAAELALVVATGDDVAVHHDQRTDRHVAVLGGGPRLLEGEAHQFVVVRLGHTATVAAR